jgi:hypothetical protein
VWASAVGSSISHTSLSVSPIISSANTSGWPVRRAASSSASSASARSSSSDGDVARSRSAAFPSSARSHSGSPNVGSSSIEEPPTIASQPCRLLAGARSNRSVPYQFIRVAEAMAELGLDDEVLTWSTRGIAKTNGWQISQLYDLACGVHARCEEPLEVLALRRAQHERMPSTSTYRALRTAAEELDAWPLEQDAARATLRRADVRGFVDALLGDSEIELAWSVAVAGPQEALGSDLWLRLAESGERDRPADALAVYQRIADEVLERADRRAYRSAARILQRAQAAARAADMLDEFGGRRPRAGIPRAGRPSWSCADQDRPRF